MNATATAAVPSLWMLTLLAATCSPTPGTLLTVLFAWVGLNIYWPIDWPIHARRLAVISAVPQALTVVLAVLALRRGSNPQSSSPI